MLKVKATALGPFLSDEAAVAMVKGDWTLKRRETSSTHCYWSKNLGFSIKLTVEPLATISVTDTIADHEAVAFALAKNIDNRFK